jgi:FAD/FMN-containing dehydrogenase
MTAPDLVDTPVGKPAREALRRAFRGPVVLPGDEAYDEVRAVYNGMIDKRPALIARCTGTADVIEAVRFAREHDLVIAVRGGGHNVTGNSACEGGILIDLQLMRGMHVDPARRRSWAQGGMTWAQFDRESQVHGLATPGGVVSTTGVAGFSLVGGMGWLMRRHGLTADNVLGAEMVTAAAEVVRADAEENPELYWGLRGAGGNFGIVTTFEHALHPVGPTIYGGTLFYPFEQADELFRFYREFVEAPAPDDLTIWIAWLYAPSAPHVPKDVQGRLCFAIAGCWAGPLEHGERLMQPWRDVAEPLVDDFRPRSYTDLQRMLDRTAPPGGRNYWKSDYFDSMDDEAIDAINAGLPHMPSRRGQVHVGIMEGAYGRVGEEDTAFRRRDARYFIQYVTMWDDPGDDEENIGWTREYADTVKPYTTGGVYLNFIGDEGAERVREAYGPAKWQRLVALKDEWDPENVFRLNQNIPPSGWNAVTES